MSVPVSLLISSDDALAAAVLRLAAGAGAPVDVHPTVEAGLRAWGSAPTVLVGPDLAADLAAYSPPRRSDVHVATLGVAPDSLFRSALDLGAASVLELPAADEWLVALLADVGDGRVTTATTVAVVAGSGGAGSTVLAASLALTAGASGRAMLVDLDPLGPGLHRLVGLDDRREVTWRELADSEGRLGSRALRDALPQRDGVGVLGWPDEPMGELPAALVREVVSAGQRGHDWVFLDLPRTTELPGTGLLGRCDHVVLVVRSGLAGVASAARVADRMLAEAPSTELVVRRRRGAPQPEDVARALGLPLAAELSDQRRLDEHLDLGLGPVHSRRSPLASTARRLVSRWGVGR